MPASSRRGTSSHRLAPPGAQSRIRRFPEEHRRRWWTATRKTCPKRAQAGRAPRDLRQAPPRRMLAPLTVCCERPAKGAVIPARIRRPAGPRTNTVAPAQERQREGRAPHLRQDRRDQSVDRASRRPHAGGPLGHTVTPQRVARAPACRLSAASFRARTGLAATGPTTPEGRLLSVAGSSDQRCGLRPPLDPPPPTQPSALRPPLPRAGCVAVFPVAAPGRAHHKKRGAQGPPSSIPARPYGPSRMPRTTRLSIRGAHAPPVPDRPVPAIGAQNPVRPRARPLAVPRDCDPRTAAAGRVRPAPDPSRPVLGSP